MCISPELGELKVYNMKDIGFKRIEVTPISGALGALVTGVELKNPLQKDVFAEI